MQQPSSIWLLPLVRFSLALTLCVIALGAYTRLSDAGLGCPDWPGCYGHYTVPQTSSALEKAQLLYPDLDVEPHKAWPEMVHRYFAGTLGIVVFAITFLCLKHKVIAITLPLTIAAIVVFQALLGMWTVTLKLLPLVVMGHLLGGFCLLSVLWILLWRLKTQIPTNAQIPTNINDIGNVSMTLKLLSAASLFVVIGQVMLGGWTSSNYAALMCSSLPICEGNWSQYLDFKSAFTLIHHGHDSYEFGVLDYGSRLTIHVTHRIGAMITIIVIGTLAMRLWKRGFQSLAKMLVGALCVQVVLGISNVVFNLPLTIAVLHNIGAALLLVTVLKCNVQLWSVKPCVAQTQTRSVSHE